MTKIALPMTAGATAPTPAAAGPAAGSGTAYTCPMHPEIKSDRPGSCPICGMALEPVTISEDAEVDPELEDMSRRLWISLALTLPLLLLSMADMVGILTLPSGLSGRSLVWVELLLATPVVLWGGRRFFERGWASVVSRKLNMFTLIALGTGSAYVFARLRPWFPDYFRLRSATTTAPSRCTSSRPQ